MNTLPAVQHAFPHLPPPGAQADTLRAQIATALTDRWRAPMPVSLRSAYYRQQLEQQRSFLVLMVLLGQGAFLLLWTADLALLPDVAVRSAIYRAVFVLTMAPLGLWMLRRAGQPLRADAVLQVSVVLAAVLSFDLSTRSTSGYGSFYLYASPVFLMLCNVGARLVWRSGALSALAITAVMAEPAWRLHQQDPRLFALLCVAYLPMLGFSLAVSWHTTLEARRAYLLSVLDWYNRVALADAHEQVRLLSRTDPLTRILNRRGFEERLAELQTLGGFALFIVDVDHFKAYNDHYGHPAGDDCLCRIAALLRDGAECQGGLAYRYGGEEFALLLPDCDADRARQVADGLAAAVEQAALAHARRPDGLQMVTVSIGAAASGPPEADGTGTGTDALVGRADTMLYAAKSAGRNRARIAPPAALLAPGAVHNL
ncbi:GGDEF domain-containing protein [uncultured Xylophilus sp.]|uniref:GGDEF domain-containing protein n=1 Tax=uncultured Xylophilus sp. TaxID=296832 RepID=UPI00260091B2|nr:GGDEF domain-containing protein [uncultured Xylophilus sp.]